ncbi:MAG: class I SAM-dependent methyltransferase, partial [Gammaproteobacteria bacterium]|nr:class I SAM-dependent methyltransferase [Gammaproteobacteria bacterium]
MPDSVTKTREMLALHHRDGVQFAQMMRDGFARRYDDNFWQFWQQWIEPVYSTQPLVLDLGTGPALFIGALGQRTPGIRAIGVECATYMLDAVAQLPT